MGMSSEKCLLYELCSCKTAPCAVRKPDEGCPIYRHFKELIIRNYNARLKADMVAMFTELLIKMDELEVPYMYWNEGVALCQDMITQKINKLKEVKQ